MASRRGGTRPRRRAQTRRAQTRRLGPSIYPEVLLLEQFTLDAVRNGKNYAREVARYQWDYYAALAQQRAEKSDDIRKALVGAAEGPFPFKGWQRIVDYQYSLHPLSSAGSVLTDPGGRFNIGDIDRARFPPFPALYLASDQPTAIVEKFGLVSDNSGLSNLDFALRSGPSFTCVSVSGSLDAVIDLQHPERLQAFVDIIRKFRLPPDLAARSTVLKMHRPTIVATVEELVAAITTPEWRNEPMQVDIPAAPQLFGQLVWMAGIEGILFPSSKNGQTCLAVFPENLSASSYVELDHKAPAGVTALRLDGTNYRAFVP